jgi:AcrR family transcriptional regulator
VVQILDSRRKPPRGEARRAEILRRAAAVFRERGFHGAGMRDIAKSLGMTPGNLYYYFRSKDDLLYECQRLALDRLQAGVRRAAAGGGSAADRLRTAIRDHVLCLLVETGGSAAHLEFRALPGPRRAEIARGRDAYERTLRRLVEDGVRAGEFRPVDAKLATRAILGALNATVTWWRPEGPMSPAEIADAYATTLVGGLRT